MTANRSGHGWRAALLCLAGAWLTTLPATAQKQDRPTAVAVAGPQYEARALQRLLLGGNWRVLWTTPVRVPVLDLGTYAGGLEPFEEGGRQSRTLHFRTPDERRYIFRSVGKYLHREALPPAVRHTLMGDVIQDGISMLLPGVGLIMAPLQEAAGALHSPSEFVVMPDDPRLGEWRETFAGMLGQIEENPDELPDDEPGFAGSRKVVKAASMLERLDESTEHRLHSRDYLALRLVDFLVNDTDRGGDQWKFARFPEGDRYVWRPVPRDHDFALLKSGGLFGFIAQLGYPKLSSLDDDFPSLKTLTFMTRDMDRRLLADIPRPAWDSVVSSLQTALTDDVLAASIGRLPAEYQPHTGGLVATLRARRDRLHEVADEFYAMVATEADVFTTDEPERARVERLGDGAVNVTVTSIEHPDRTVFERRFVPGETREIRLFMRGGDDEVLVHGSPAEGIKLRVVGGDGADVLADSVAASSGAATTLYADEDDRVSAADGTEVDRRPFEHTAPGRPEDLYGMCCGEEPGDEDLEGQAGNEDVERRLAGARYRDWGSTGGFGPVVQHRSGVGIVLGVAHTRTSFGFRHVPHEYTIEARALYGVESGKFGAELFAQYRPENASWGLEADAHAWQFESFRFFGYGNDTPEDLTGTRVHRDDVLLRPALFWERAAGRLSVGPVARYGKLRYDEGSLIAGEQPLGSAALGQVGAWSRAELAIGPLSEARPGGMRVELEGAGYPAAWDVPDAFSRIGGLVHAFLPVPGAGATFLVVRGGGEKLFGDFPVHEAAFLGGRHTLRGYATDRFAGDASLYGSTQLHVPLGTIELLVRGQLGAFGLADAGRVYVDGASPGGWHTAFGGGLRFASLGRAVSVSYVQGEGRRVYLRMGLPF
ncbi:MAG: hypothetical protein WEB88_06640 [Gemmatimonadota bacterium]